MIVSIRPKKNVWLPSTAFFKEGRSVGRFFFFFLIFFILNSKIISFNTFITYFIKA